jgi:DeoR/GlpR family transcriptional regulator of sugar metabolism
VAQPGEHPRRRQLVPEERRRLILGILHERGSVTVAALEDEFGISPMTARRDLTMLAEEGRLRRTHGGALLPELAAHEDSFRHRLDEDADAKRRLAEAVAATVEPSETIFLDSSTTAYLVAQAILERGVRVTLLTNSLPVMLLADESDAHNVDLVGLGGTFRELTRSFVGGDTVRAIEGFFADRVVFSVKGISPDGRLTDPDALEAAVKRAMIGHANTVLLVAGAAKFEDRGLNVVTPASSVHIAWFEAPAGAGAQALRAAGVDVRLV